MRILILGGTQFIGRHIVEGLVAAGHHASVLTRGKTPDELPEQVERLRGDRDHGVHGLPALAGRTWDACVDVSGYTARQVRASAEMLCSAVKRYLYVSAVSVYEEPSERPIRESHPRLKAADEDVIEVDGETYGPLKVTCENIVQGVYHDRCTILRPQIVVGPHDPSGRYTYWLNRAAQGGQMLAPGDGSDHVQVIDVRDIAQFARRAIEKGLSGAFNMAGPRLTWTEFVRLLGAANPVWVAAETLNRAGVTEFELPLFRAERGPRSGLMDVCNERARAAGLTLTDPETTLRDVRAWGLGKNLTPLLSPEREAELLWIARNEPAHRD